MSETFQVAPLAARDLPEALDIFVEGFGDSVRRLYGDPPRTTATQDVWRFCLAVEPEGFLGARSADGVLLGYAFFTRSLGRLQRAAILRARPLVWALRALTGGYGIVWKNLWGLLRDKLWFVASARRFRTKGDAQLLNIAVASAARGRGVAKALVLGGLDYLRACAVSEVRLEVRPDNASAVKAYLDCGFREVGRAQDVHGEWIVMIASLR